MISEDDIKFWGPKYGSIYPYLETSTPYNNLIDDIFSFLDFNKEDVILDCGAGSGLIIKRILEEFDFIKHIDALDVSKVMLSHLKNKLKFFDNKITSKVNLVQHDLSYPLPFKDNVYDKIISNLVLTYIISYEGKFGEDVLAGVLSEMYRVLKKNGVIVWTTPINNVKFVKVFLASWRNILNLKYYKRLYYGPLILGHALTIQKKGKEGVYHFYNKDRIENILLRCGFTDIQFKRSFAKQAWVINCKK
ncbi:MAG: hypothetical protein COV55_00490 [Candidatus Komeilibacteria bacterium CG11_big_fil_rev_8_21_14_0_20_36_20]|uniref:Methyltransferase type 11 domain-containing protein n=1 Tax=Candidatus Komeilibacteria bacterium CG11_big_fil_rev_8_21_14_0_20_36_20 TaxID=1974477 RepID=A0A2H0NGL5_9BACT|nr:MAG: hypothetical protein COV55_00490 [Candidatus Komeilibacteria bacterium CG11_big_fil_rev_8_21_14_0_20_36_20]PIR81661.1 MAG: hypothetical protein COU21_02345 [Candidatus Komeilibacteria bacterium CG10_big_fil_rev_8_21_14_0_10_36_65]PJC55592.1 MAG: hypothetical protein CO027_01155 [Candidatus Komeilibacteria bacterium CG_4_9_14_0_2_um_filter_36_13]